MSSAFIPDGYTQTKTFPAKPGLHPEVVAEYRPALARKRQEYARQVGNGDPAKIDDYENLLLAEHVVGLNGERVTKDNAARVYPVVRAGLIDAVLSYEPADQKADQGNSSPG